MSFVHRLAFMVRMALVGLVVLAAPPRFERRPRAHPSPAR